MPQFGGASEKCHVCSKTVYLAEKIVVEDKEEKKTFHKVCLKCTHCKATLSLGNYASMNGVMYCKPHFKQLFATKGNYDEGFGKEKLTSKWTPNTAPATTSGSFVPVEKTEEPKAQEKKDTPSSIASRFQRSSLVSERCEKCSKTVYATEKIVIEEKDGKKVYHKTCLRCTHCQVVLTLSNYAAMNGITYCKPHLKQLFATKGNYDEGFGKEKHSTKWEPQTSGSPSTFVPIEKTEVPKEVKSTPAPSDVANKFKNTADKCTACGKTVYLTEKIVVEDKEEKKLFHKSCLRCSHCQVVLSLGNYASMGGVMYCKPHFKQLFATKGNYDEGFGKEKHSAKWIDQDDKDRAAAAVEVPHSIEESPRNAEPVVAHREEESTSSSHHHHHHNEGEELSHNSHKEEDHHHDEQRVEEDNHHHGVYEQQQTRQDDHREDDDYHREQEREVPPPHKSNSSSSSSSDDENEHQGRGNNDNEDSDDDNARDRYQDRQDDD